MRKGISLPVETTVVIVLAVVVLVALLFFFSGTFGTGVDRIKLEQRKVDLCTKYVSQDSECRGTWSKELQDTCKQLEFNHLRACCTGYCPRITTKAECNAISGASCIAVACSQAAVLKTELGNCNDDPGFSFCCIAPS